MISRSWSRWAVGAVLGAGLLLLYFSAWRPARALLTQHVVHPLFTSIETERADTFQYSFARGALRVGLRSSRPSINAPNYHAPAGGDFLLPALILVLLFPYRPYWVYLWGFHLVVGALFLGLLAVGIAWSDAAFALQHFLEHYLAQALSLSAPLLALAYERDVFAGPAGPSSSEAAS